MSNGRHVRVRRSIDLRNTKYASLYAAFPNATTIPKRDFNLSLPLKKIYIYIYMLTRACIFKEKGRRTGSPRVQKKVSRELFDFTFVAYICERGHIGSIWCSLRYSACISDRIRLGHVYTRVYGKARVKMSG